MDSAESGEQPQSVWRLYICATLAHTRPSDCFRAYSLTQQFIPHNPWRLFLLDVHPADAESYLILLAGQVTKLGRDSLTRKQAESRQPNRSEGVTEDWSGVGANSVAQAGTQEGVHAAASAKQLESRWPTAL
jgi:hypothetical protein